MERGSLTKVLRGDCRSVSINWKIEQMSSCRESSDDVLSPLFTCCDAEWRLLLRPRNFDQRIEIFKMYYNVVLCKHSENSVHEVFYRTVIEDSEGQTLDSVTNYNVFEGSSLHASDARFYLNSVIPKGRFFGARSVLPENVLYICCNLTVREEESDLRRRDVAVATDAMGGDALIRDFRGLLSEGKLCDVVLRVEGHEFPAHKLILRARSCVFAAMFDQDMEESRSGTVDIVDLSSAAISDMLTYIYTDDVRDLGEEEASELYVAADKYALDDLKRRCSDVLVRHLSQENVCDVAVLGDTFNDRRILDCVKAFVLENISIHCTKEWKDLVEKKPHLATEILMAVSSELSKKK